MLDVAYRTVDTPARHAAAGRDRRRAWSGSPTRTQGHDAALAQLAELVSPRILHAPARLDAAARQLDEYFARRRRAFDLPLDLRLSDGFRRSVLDAPAGRSPTGATESYAQVAAAAGNPRAVRAVGTRVRHQPAADRGALPPGGALRRLARRLRRRPGRQAVAARPGGGVMTTATATRPVRQTDSGRPDWDGVARASSTTYGCALLPAAADAGRVRADRRALRRDRRTSAPRSTWRGTGSGRASTATSRRRSPSRSTRCGTALYPRLLPIARDWYARLGRRPPWPDTLDEWLDVCHAAGQTRPTPILLRYGTGDWNALHRDLYGDLVFPLQVVINLSDPGADHTGGEFLLRRAAAPGAVARHRDADPAGPRAGLHHPRPAGRAPRAAGRPRRSGTGCRRSAPAARYTLGLVFHDAA